MIANRDFYFKEYADPRAEFERAGLEVRVAAGTLQTCHPHPESGQGELNGDVMPDLTIAEANASHYSTIVFVGGWGASSYQYAYPGVYSDAHYRGTPEIKQAVNALINDFVQHGKLVNAVSHGVTILAWARVNGHSPLEGKRVCSWADASPEGTIGTSTSRWHIEQNGATMVPSRSIGDISTATDDVIVDGNIITGENYDSAREFGRVVASRLLGN